MRNKMKTKIISSALVAALATGSMISSAPMLKTTAAENSELTATAEPTAEPTVQPTAKPTAKPTTKPTKKPNKITYTPAGFVYCAKGEPKKCVLSKKAKFITVTGSKYKKSGRQITFTANKDSKIKYKAGNKYKYIDVIVNGNKTCKTQTNKKVTDKRINRKEYTCDITDNNKHYKNFIEWAKKNVGNGWMWQKNELKKNSKYNRGIKNGDSSSKVLKKYPSWEDEGWDDYGEFVTTARYYEKKSKLSVYKNFYYNKKDKITKIAWISYNPKVKEYNIKLK